MTGHVCSQTRRKVPSQVKPSISAFLSPQLCISFIHSFIHPASRRSASMCMELCQEQGLSVCEVLPLPMRTWPAGEQSPWCGHSDVTRHVPPRA